MRRMLRNAAVAAALAMAGGTLATASPAQAIPYPKDNQSVVYTYYSDASRTVQVGTWIYGNCLEDFFWGTKTAYYEIDTVTCPAD
ncbi:hypothetical protein [Micromonospora cathayae]|uniref:Uncharacterized protein n=1 Tax=Micromonospora cathayae TaxID=3028804 RepID=A0ABY7ZUF9_9ACTN|nr:hypothetical protein [Micromonospora sp. HUAS 3]WDZ86133.1 hypothetical protein PVK37_06855 [Micromonospora sp. HUAS 3]